MRVQLMGTEDPSVNGMRTAQSRWREYVQTYVMRHPTEWVTHDEKENTGAKVFLAR